ncbi:MAG: glycosyltransferase family 2 protein [Bacteroidales bacterium]|nr:glycosyltransferase family 2 protein [Bacteroidales bacterium]
MKNVGVSILVHGTSPDELRKALGCVAASSVVNTVWVIDNSDDDSLKRVAEEFGTVYRHVENRGFGAGHNVAIRESLAQDLKYHLVMNADVCWEGDVLSALQSYMDANPDVGIVMPKVRYPDGDLQYACRMLPTPYDLFTKRFLPGCLTRRRMERYLLADADHDRPFNVPYLLGSFLFFRSDALRQEGLFDERFFMYPEDIDITRRIHRAWRTMFWPGVTIIHAHAAASRRNLRMFRIHLTNMFRYFNKWGWFVDPERRRFNRRLRAEMPRLSGPRPCGRG